MIRPTNNYHHQTWPVSLELPRGPGLMWYFEILSRVENACDKHNIKSTNQTKLYQVCIYTIYTIIFPCYYLKNSLILWERETSDREGHQHPIFIIYHLYHLSRHSTTTRPNFTTLSNLILQPKKSDLSLDFCNWGAI